MNPTNELRWVMREVPASFGKYHMLKILQQKWATYWSDDMGGSIRDWQWIDVPTEEEAP